jgi:hypothetical protein
VFLDKFMHIPAISSSVQIFLECGATLAMTSLFFSHCAPASLILSAAGALTTSAALIADSPTLHRLSRVINRTALASIIGGGTIHPLIHEGGHAFLASLLYKSPHIAISLSGMAASTTYSAQTGLTWLGSLFGKEWSPIIVAAGGCLGSLTWGLLATPPILIYSGLARLFSEACYALTALRAVGWNPGHDYQYLWIYGNVTPLVPTALLLGAFTFRVFEAMNS